MRYTKFTTQAVVFLFVCTMVYGPAAVTHNGQANYVWAQAQTGTAGTAGAQTGTAGTAGAQTGTAGTAGAQTGTAGTANNSSAASNSDFSIPNPLGEEGPDDLMSLVQLIVEKIVIPLGAIFVVLAIIYSGFRFVMAQGNEEELKVAKKNFLYVLIGAAILLGAWVIATAVKGTLELIGIEFWG